MQFRTLAASLAAVAMMAVSSVAIAQEATPTDSDPVFLAQTQVRTGPRPSLTDDQLLKLRALKDQMSVETAQKRAQLKALKHQMFDKMSAPAVNKAEVVALNNQINAIKTDLSNSRLNFMLAAGDIFTPEQKAAFRSRMLRRGMWGGGGRGHGRGHHGGFHGGKGGFHGKGGFGGGACPPGGCPGGKGGPGPDAKST
jgi:Spy/CpxP family protein refolding chaperone